MIPRARYRNILLIIITLMTPFCCCAAEKVDFLDDDFYADDIPGDTVPDPLEPFNRAMFEFNDVTYTYVLDPVASAYSEIVAQDFRTIIGNFFNNLEEPVRFVNCLLQGRVRDSGTVLGRFAVNTVFGVFGLGDPARTEFDLQPTNASLGETLAVWGVHDGFYLVMPLFGSTTLRDFSGTMVDAFFATPYYSWTDDYSVMAGIYVGKEVNKLSFHLNEYDELKKMSFDPYIALRNGYFQYRERLRDHSGYSRKIE
ncbi:MlaA family lipoprotein [Desulfogranum japonicum]|uniref:MlaA family lipoprotein n=1 Tax=Desulfogranum japonicum TaxID=231447 RepID=UPI00041D6345|nr:VacJ family lipoprotein [Desulfogranum japonicum]